MAPLIDIFISVALLPFPPPLSTSFPPPSLHSPLLSVHCFAASLRPTGLWGSPETHRGSWCVVVFCLWGQSCAMLLFPGPRPFTIVCCHMEASTNMEISLSSCCSLTFSGTQLALNAEIIIIPITQANSVASSLCVLIGCGVGMGGGSSVECRGLCWRKVPH